MENELIELCPICIENPVTHYTECNHGYCIGCLCRITKCSMCRNPLQRANICIEIKRKVKLINEPYRNPLIYNSSEDFVRRLQEELSRNRDYTYIFTRNITTNNTRLNFNHPARELVWTI